MAAQGEVIKSFLVGLGFEVDASSLAAFNKAIVTSALRVTGLYTAVNAFAASIVFAFAKISEGFEEMGYQYHIIAPAINKAIVLRQELLKAYGAAGINIRKVIVDSINLNMSLAKTRFAMEAIYKSVGSKFFGQLQKQSDAFRKKLYENMPYIIAALTKLVSTVFKAFDAVTILGQRLWSILGRVWDFFVKLDQATDGWSTVILGVVAAWKLLNLEFLATPLGLLLSAGVALLALYDDFKTWKEGGKSLFDWSKIEPEVDAAIDALSQLLDIVMDLAKLFKSIWDADFSGFISGIKKLDDAAAHLFNTLLGIKDTEGGGQKDILDKGFDWLMDKVSPNMGPPTMNLQNPLGNAPTSQTNVNATFQTDVNISGSPNAAATGQATAAAQTSVNRDGVRYLKGVTR